MRSNPVTTWLRTAGESLAGSFGGIVEQTDAIWESGRDSGLSDSQIQRAQQGNSRIGAQTARNVDEAQPWKKRRRAPVGPASELAPGTAVATAAFIEIAKQARHRAAQSHVGSLIIGTRLALEYRALDAIRRALPSLSPATCVPCADSTRTPRARDRRCTSADRVPRSGHRTASARGSSSSLTRTRLTWAQDGHSRAVFVGIRRSVAPLPARATGRNGRRD